MTRNSGEERLKKSSKSLVWTTFDDNEKKRIRTAAAIEGKPMSRFVVEAALSASEKILKNFKNNS